MMQRRQTARRGKPAKKGAPVTALAANSAGEIFELEGYAAAGMAGDRMVPLTLENTLPMPHGGELMFLAHRSPVAFNRATGRPEVIPENPFAPGEPICAVAAFNSPGYVNACVSAYRERTPGDILPLFSYGAVGWQGGGFRSAVICVDREPRQDLRRMPREKVVEGVLRMQKILPENRLRRHLERCALEYGCPAGKNFFLGRYEAPLPTSRVCNARCLGCISLQPAGGVSCSQERIDFTPTPEEIAGVALAHIRRVDRAVVSFGQGCEGDPLLAAHVIEPAIRLIRRETDRGTINMNTNASLPDVLSQLIDAGLDSIRVSMNSVREACYHAYFRPGGYGFADVVKSIDTALARGRFVSVNYLNCPGFTDTPEEVAAFMAFRRAHPVHFIQWRNLNYDPVRYWAAMNRAASHGAPLGMAAALSRIRRAFPDLQHGYFNPPKEKWGKNKDKE
ncbi:radical SAM protein [Desulfococcus sp.]|uniref:radical SAM protein n=1 Tax=Desulfococcus sp. TaxID=2025834 RepID=UPI00359400FD